MAEIAEEIAEKYGKEACAYSILAAEKFGISESHKNAIMRFAQAAAAMVPEFRGEHAPAISDCPECPGTGIIILEEWAWQYRRKVERAYACQRCDEGIRVEAMIWFERLYPLPIGSKKRESSTQGWREFHKFFGDRIRRKDIVLARMRSFKNYPEVSA